MLCFHILLLLFALNLIENAHSSTQHSRQTYSLEFSGLFWNSFRNEVSSYRLRQLKLTQFVSRMKCLSENYTHRICCIVLLAFPCFFWKSDNKCMNTPVRIEYEKGSFWNSINPTHKSIVCNKTDWETWTVFSIDFVPDTNDIEPAGRPGIN